MTERICQNHEFLSLCHKFDKILLDAPKRKCYNCSTEIIRNLD